MDKNRRYNIYIINLKPLMSVRFVKKPYVLNTAVATDRDKRKIKNVVSNYVFCCYLSC